MLQALWSGSYHRYDWHLLWWFPECSTASPRPLWRVSGRFGGVRWGEGWARMNSGRMEGLGLSLTLTPAPTGAALLLLSKYCGSACDLIGGGRRSEIHTSSPSEWPLFPSATRVEGAAPWVMEENGENSAPKIWCRTGFYSNSVRH